jgi:hypothetical protein
MAVDFGLKEFTQLTDQLTAGDLKARGNNGLTDVVLGLSSVLKNLIAYTIKRGKIC